MRRLALLAVVVGCAVAGSTPAVAKEGCVTRHEYDHVKRGNTLPAVHRYFETNGTLVGKFGAGGYIYVLREYVACDPPGGHVQIEYRKEKGSTQPFKLRRKFEAFGT